MSIFSSLTRDQREAVGLLQIGTFLEYFDLMLYVHMAAILNQLFFPETDAKTAALLAAFAFCSTYVLRPFGALLFGFIGDRIGRKTTVILTTMMMATSCIIMATLPTYAQIGITAAWIVTLCRIAQGLSSMGEIIGAEIYLTEITKPPVSYPIVGLIGCASRFGTMVALGVATLVTSYAFNWRAAFWVGAAIAVIGSVARTRLRETAAFVNMKKRLKSQKEDAACQSNADPKLMEDRVGEDQPVHWKTSLAFFLIYAGPPMCLYFSYIYCGGLLKKVGFTGEQVISQNFIVSALEFLGILITVRLSYRIHPLKIIKLKGFLFIPFLLATPFILYNNHTANYILLVQLISVCLTITPVPAVASMVTHFPVFRRFTYASFMYAMSRAVIHVVSSFGLVYLTDYLGYWGLYFIMIPVTVGFLWGVTHFEKLENIYQPNTAYNRFSSRLRQRLGVVVPMPRHTHSSKVRANNVGISPIRRYGTK